MKFSEKIAIVMMLMLMSAKCDKASEICEEKDVPGCNHTMQYDPVCGCNNKTYGNAGEAECHGITKFTKGECPK